MEDFLIGFDQEIGLVEEVSVVESDGGHWVLEINSAYQ